MRSELAALAPFEADGLVKRTPTGLEVTDTGRLFIRNIAMCFDNTLAPGGRAETFEDDLRMKSVAIIGAGITGLTAAFYLKRKGIPVTVYEAGGRVGGVIQSLRQDGFLAEFGPNTILETSPKIAQLVRDAGLESRRLDPDPEGRGALRRPLPAADCDAGFAAGIFHDANCSPPGPSWPCCANRSCRRAAMAWRKASPNSSCAG